MATDINEAEPYHITLLKKEYEIIQSKIDKIGEFKSKIRGWSITVLSAALAGLISKEMSYGYWLMSLAIPFIFHFLEFEEDILSVALGRRARDIEKYLSLYGAPSSSKTDILLRKAAKAVNSVPRVAVEMGTAKSAPVNWEKCFAMKRFNWFLWTQVLLIVGLFTISRGSLTSDGWMPAQKRGTECQTFLKI